MIQIDPSWILQHGMHNDPNNSRFYNIASGKVTPFRLWAEPILEDGIVISVAIFEEYPDTAAFWGSFTSNRKRHLMKCHGRIGLFTLPEHRKKGNAQRALNLMLEELSLKAVPETINLIAGAHTIIHRFKQLPWPQWAPVVPPVGRNFWEEILRKKIQQSRQPSYVTTQRAIEVLKSKGYIEKERDGKMRLFDETHHPEYRTLTRFETLSLTGLRRKPSMQG